MTLKVQERLCSVGEFEDDKFRLRLVKVEPGLTM